MKLLIFATLLSYVICKAPVQYRQSKPIAILNSNSDVSPDGNYRYSYETENGIAVQEQGKQRFLPSGVGSVAKGSYKYTSPEGVPVVVNYIADENGFQPHSSILPTSPPIPPAILRSLEYIAARNALRPFGFNRFAYRV